MTAATTILDRLDGVAERGPSRWVARCPSHDDRTPSLSVREADDGTILLHCWSGCDAADIVAAAGLTLADLFPAREQQHRHHTGGQRPRISASDALHLLSRESTAIAIASRDMIDRGPLAPADHDRLVAAAGRVAMIAEAAR